jgi:hypothetical protein
VDDQRIIKGLRENPQNGAKWGLQDEDGSWRPGSLILIGLFSNAVTTALTSLADTIDANQRWLKVARSAPTDRTLWVGGVDYSSAENLGVVASSQWSDRTVVVIGGYNAKATARIGDFILRANGWDVIGEQCKHERLSGHNHAKQGRKDRRATWSAVLECPESRLLDERAFRLVAETGTALDTGKSSFVESLRRSTSELAIFEPVDVDSVMNRQEHPFASHELRAFQFMMANYEVVADEADNLVEIDIVDLRVKVDGLLELQEKYGGT